MSYGEPAIKEGGVELDPLYSHDVDDSRTRVTPGEQSIEWQKIDGCSSFGQGGAIISRVALYAKSDGSKIDAFEGGTRVVFCMEIAVKKDIASPIVGFHLSNPKGIHLLGINNAAAGITLGPLLAGDVKTVQFEFDFPYLKHDIYSFSPAIAEGTQAEHIQHHWVHDAYVVRVSSADELAHLGTQLVIKENFEIRVV